MNFDDAFEKLLGHEGGFSDSPKDRGNWTSGKPGVGELKGTKYGISAMSYPLLDIRNLTVDDAKMIYRRDFWGAVCESLPDGVRFDYFDTAVNSGPWRATWLLQGALGVAQDGRIGPITLAAIKAMDPARLLARFNGWRLDALNDDPAQWAEFGRGWSQRIANNLKAA